MAGLKEKKILIHADGSHAIGLGHIYRMKTLALVLKSLAGRPAFLSLADETAMGILDTTRLPVFPFSAHNYRKILKNTIADFQPDIIIQDILDTTPISIEQLRRQTQAKLIHFDDTEAGLETADIVINSMVFHWRRYQVDDVCAKLFEGPQYAILQPEISKYTDFQKPIPDRADKVLISFGGTDTHFMTDRALTMINGIDAPLKIIVNMGPGSRITEELEKAVETSKHQVELVQATPNLIAEFINSDLVICGGGTMLYELAALGVPSACVATEPHEVYNMEYWADQGTTVELGWEMNLDHDYVKQTIASLIEDRNLRTEMSQRGKEIVDDQGALRIVNIIAESLN